MSENPRPDKHLVKGAVALVTGASRGAGKGIARELARKGYCVYITGRTKTEGQQHDGQTSLPGTVHSTAELIKSEGGHCIPVICDHASDSDVKALVSKIRDEQGGLDVLVNNAAYIHDDLVKPGPFWTKSIALATILDVGLRSTYSMTHHAAPLMIKQQHALVINTSSPGARCYMHGPAYGGQKAGTDKMTWDMAHDFRPHDVACISIWMGILKTERSEAAAAAAPELYADIMAQAESPEFTGRIIDALYRSSSLMERSGKTYVGAELALELDVTDLDGKQPTSHAPMLGDPIDFSSAVVE